MGKSIQRQLGDISYSSTASNARRAAAIHALQSNDWMPLMKGRQAYYRDLLLDVIAYFVDEEVDPSRAPSVIKAITDDGYLWELIRRVNNNTTLASNVIYAAVRSLEVAGEEVTAKNSKLLMDFYMMSYSARPFMDIPFHAGVLSNLGWKRVREIKGFDPEVTRRMVSVPASSVSLLEIAQRGIVRGAEALSILDGEVVPALSSGSL